LYHCQSVWPILSQSIYVAAKQDNENVQLKNAKHLTLATLDFAIATEYNSLQWIFTASKCIDDELGIWLDVALEVH